MKIKTALSYFWKLPLCGAAFFGGMALSGALLPLSGLQTPGMPQGADADIVAIYYLMGSIFLAITLSFLSKNLAMHGLPRWGLLAGLAWTVGVAGMVLESAFFMNTGAVSSAGAVFFTLLNFVLPSIMFAGAVSWLFPSDTLKPPTRPQFSLKTWIWKVVLALLAYPVVYILFGLIVQPAVSCYYTAELFELSLPTWGQLVPLQIARSALFLAVCLPVIRNWGHTKRALWLSFGGAFFSLTAFMAVITSYWFPWQLRLFHGLELLASAYVYAGILVRLFIPAGEADRTFNPIRREVSPRIVLFSLSVLILAGCSPGGEPLDQVFTAPEFSAAYRSNGNEVLGKLIVSNHGDSLFPGDDQLDGKMTLWTASGEPRAGLDQYSLPIIEPGESYQASSMEWILEPGTYFLAWGAPAYGGVLSVFSVEEKDGSLILGKTHSFRTKPAHFESGIENPGQIKEFRLEDDGGIFISGETPLPDQNCVLPLLYSQEGLVEGFPAGVCAPIADGRWSLEIPASPDKVGVQFEKGKNYRMMLFSGDLRLSPSEPFEIRIPPQIQY